jgi:hypothetical protein
MHAELKPVNERPKNSLVHLDRFREANGFSHYTFDPRAQREMFAFQLLCPPLATTWR